MAGFGSWVVVLGTAEPVGSHTVYLLRNFGWAPLYQLDCSSQYDDARQTHD